MSKSLDFSKATAKTPHDRRLTRGVFWLLRFSLAVVFLASGLAKLAGVPAMNEIVAQVQPGAGFRWAVGIAQIVGGVLLLLRGSSIAGAIVLVVVMLGVLMLQYVIDGELIFPILGLIYLCFAVIFERSQI